MSDSVGARLRQARELRRLTLQQVSETTKLRTHYLQALESDDHSAIPSAAQARGFLRIYAAFLELEVADLVPAARPDEPLPEPPVAANAAPSAAPRPNLWANLRGRLSPRKKEERAPGQSLLEPSVALEPDALPAQSAAPPASISATENRLEQPKSSSSKPASEGDNPGGKKKDAIS